MGAPPRLLIMLASFLCAASPDTPDVIVTSPPSGSYDDAPTTAHCPADYSMIDCRLSDDTSYLYSDGLKFDESACTAYASTRGSPVKVWLFTLATSVDRNLHSKSRKV